MGEMSKGGEMRVRKGLISLVHIAEFTIGFDVSPWHVAREV